MHEIHFGFVESHIQHVEKIRGKPQHCFHHKILKVRTEISVQVPKSRQRVKLQNAAKLGGSKEHKSSALKSMITTYFFYINCQETHASQSFH